MIVGTDHGITDPRALTWIQNDGIEVLIMVGYQGVFHPKVVWLQGVKSNSVWVGSNNLTRDGLLSNVEFAILVKTPSVPTAFKNWSEAVEAGSTSLTRQLLDSYDRERKAFESKRAAVKATTFTWTQKTEPKASGRVPAAQPGDFIVEVMPKETGSGGSQLQLPVAAASAYFGLNEGGASSRVRLRRVGSPTARSLTMTVFPNNTVRLSIGDLEYRDRPCVIVFHRSSRTIVEYDIVSQSVFPNRYASLLELCINRTRMGSRRWGIA
jgi:hypothetical protein